MSCRRTPETSRSRLCSDNFKRQTAPHLPRGSDLGSSAARLPGFIHMRHSAIEQLQAVGPSLRILVLTHRSYACISVHQLIMPSIAESRRQVKETLAAGPDHDDILASLQEEIDRHNQTSEGGREERPHKRRRHHSDDDASERGERKSRHLRFRFKSGVKEPRPRAAKHHKSRSERHISTSSDHAAEEGAAHPFPREAELDGGASNTQAFQSSLFDALADDEAAAYWESVYSQPIHVYERPFQHTPTGELESMDDETYAAYVQRKMWEKAHPEIMIERDRMEKKRQEEAEAKERRREEFVRKRRRAAWERHGRARDDDDDEKEYVFDFSAANTAPEQSKSKAYERETYAKAWSAYFAAWEKLKTELAASSPPSGDLRPESVSKRIPWPTLHGRPATRPNIEAFMQRILATDAKERVKLLKAERVRWHPDKVQQRFAGAVDEGTMKVVTGVFQVVDALVEQERGRA